ncbi:lysM domain receptor-like kinase 3 [Manihot esculenta]|uniref:Protein kinase domain-containing protein n=1 Tax=Manihot esculenta TaxID=3983 RepID=A0A2C9VJZ6_MANES|nr:lysM domain receptor-like kinase 3 [Manihot esculenta]
MCKSRKGTDVNNSLTPKSRPSRSASAANPSSSLSSSSSSNYPSFNYPSSSVNYSSSGFFNHNKDTSKSSSSSISSKLSLKSLKEAFLPENPHIYEFADICRATNNFLAKPFSSSSTSTSWRCQIRRKEVIIFQRKFRRRDPIELPELQQRLSIICRSHHSSLIKLLGAATSGNCIYLVYEFVNGANLATCLRNPQNPSYTILSNWLSRMQVATDIAHGLDYIHHCAASNSGFIHNHIKSSSILVAEDSLNAKICHFGTADLCGELEGSERSEARTLGRSNSKGMKIEGTRGYMSPEFQANGIVTQKCDVYAFGVVVLELVSGEEALRYVFDESSGGFSRVSVIEKAREAVDSGAGGVRSWVDRRLKDSYPVDVAEKMVVVGLECVVEDPEKRPDMEQVAVRVSKLYLESKNWAEKIGMPIDFSVSMAPR